MPRALIYVWLAATLVVALGAKIPKIKWSEDKEHVYLRLKVKEAKDPKVTITEDTFSFEATSDGEKYAVSFEIREDIVPKNSSWNAKGIEFAVTLGKQHAHMWDRLATDPKPLKGFISKDHGNVGGNVGISKFSVGDTEDVEDEVDESKHDVPVVRTEAAFNALLDGGVAVVEFFQPWCTHCTSFPPTMAKVAKKMAKKAKFGRVDVREARKLGRQYQVQCNYTCVYNVFKKEEGIFQVKQLMKVDEMVKELSAYMGPAVRVVKAGEVTKFVKKPHLAAVGAFASKDSSEYRAFFDAAKSELRRELSFGALVGAADAALGAAPALKLYRKFDEEVDGGQVTYGGAWANESIVQWLQQEMQPLLSEWKWDAKKSLEDSKAPMGLIFLDLPSPHEDKDEAKEKAAVPVKKLVTKVAAEFKAKLRVLIASTSQHGYMMEDLGLEKGAVPAFGIDDFSTGRKYALASTGAELTEAALRAFVQSWVDGKATPSYKSEAAPADQGSALVRKVVQKTFSAEVEGASGDVLLELHTDWSAKHKELLPRLQDLAKILRDGKSTVGVATMDSTKNAELKEMHGDAWKYDKYGEFALFLVRKGQVTSPVPLSIAKGEDAPSVLRLLEFVHQHSSEPKFDLDAAKKALEAIEAERLKAEADTDSAEAVDSWNSHTEKKEEL